MVKLQSEDPERVFLRPDISLPNVFELAYYANVATSVFILESAIGKGRGGVGGGGVGAVPIKTKHWLELYHTWYLVLLIEGTNILYFWGVAIPERM